MRPKERGKEIHSDKWECKWVQDQDAIDESLFLKLYQDTSRKFVILGIDVCNECYFYQLMWEGSRERLFNV